MGDHAQIATATITVRVQARARRNELAGTRDGLLIVRVTAPALDGRANRAVRRLLAERVGVAAGKVEIVRGEHYREKVMRIEGVEQAAVEAAIPSARD